MAVLNKPDSQIIIYQTESGKTKIEVRLHDETVWLTQKLMVELLQTTKQNISLHLINIFEEGELGENSVVKDFLTTAADGKNYNTQFYNLEAIIAVGYRVRSHRGTQFRRWATKRLNEYVAKGKNHFTNCSGHLDKYPTHLNKRKSHFTNCSGHLDKCQNHLAKGINHFGTFPNHLNMLKSHFSICPTHLNTLKIDLKTMFYEKNNQCHDYSLQPTVAKQ